jgi:hypothetical protein
MFHHGYGVISITAVRVLAGYDVGKDLPSALALSCAHWCPYAL